MATKTPLVLGTTTPYEQMNSGDTIPQSNLALYFENIYFSTNGNNLYNRQTFVSKLRKILLEDYINALVAHGLWVSHDAIWIMATENDQQSLLNIKSSSFTLAKSGTITFAKDAGYTSNGTNGKLDTGYIPSTHGVNYTQDSASVWVYSRTNTAETAKPSMGAASETDLLYLEILDGSSKIISAINETGYTASNNTTGLGLFGLNRSSDVFSQVYRDGVNIDSPNTTSSGVPTQSVYLSTHNAFETTVGYSIKQLSMAGVGGSLTDEQWADLYNDTQTFLTGIGAAV